MTDFLNYSFRFNSNIRIKYFRAAKFLNNKLKVSIIQYNSMISTHFISTFVRIRFAEELKLHKSICLSHEIEFCQFNFQYLCIEFTTPRSLDIPLDFNPLIEHK